MNGLGYLTAAYLTIWLVIGFYVWVLIRRNHKLDLQVRELEERLTDLEAKGKQ